MSLLAPTLQAFFTDRLIAQKHASAHTIAAYRDTIRLLLAFAAQRAGKPPSDLDIDDLAAPLIGAFLDHLEHERGNTICTRNARLAAIRSLLRYAALRHHAVDETLPQPVLLHLESQPRQPDKELLRGRASRRPRRPSWGDRSGTPRPAAAVRRRS